MSVYPIQGCASKLGPFYDDLYVELPTDTKDILDVLLSPSLLRKMGAAPFGGAEVWRRGLPVSPFVARSVCLAYSFTHSPTHSLTISLTISLTHYLTRLITHSLNHSLKLIPRFSLSLQTHQRSQVQRPILERGEFMQKQRRDGDCGREGQALQRSR